MTWYKITLGYISGERTEEKRQMAWQILKQIATYIAQNHYLIADEAVPFGMDETVANAYSLPYGKVNDAADETIIIREDEDKGNAIIITASGTGESRRYKEEIARAFLRIVMREAHIKKLEINIEVK